jgi:3-hydroxyanthranilate 3,4-dioxygenase
MALKQPINFQEWIESNRHLLKPPVGNKLVYEDAEFIVMVVGGPNTRSDYHIDPGEEFFHQIEGEMVLKVIDDGKPADIIIKAGEIFLLPANVPHSPQRPANTVGLVIERKRLQGELDGFAWYCPRCNDELHAEFLQLTDIVKQLPPIFERFFSSPELSTCRKCGVRLESGNAKN